MGPSMSIDGVRSGSVLAVEPRVPASMGPSMSIDGVAPGAASDEAARQTASMGPSMSIDGVPRLKRRRRSPRPGFNGAVDEHRRSRGLEEWRSAEEVLLQWGRR